MTEEAEKLISTAKEEDKDDASGEKENVNHGESEMKTDTYDLVVLGASGFTGQYVVQYVFRAVKEHGITWAVAGRNETKLRSVLKSVGEKLGEDISHTPVLTCDSSSPESLLAMARQARVVLNCVGPYRFHGEQVVKACLEAGAHHIDLSGEPQYLETIQLRYHEEAERKGVYIVGACGFDSIPADLGSMVLAQGMGGDVATIETYLKVTVPDVPGPMINYATWQSAIHGFSHASELAVLRRELYPERLPRLQPRLSPRGNLHWSNLVGSWCLPFPGSDKSVMYRTQRYLYHKDGLRPAQMQCYVQVSSLPYCLLTTTVGVIFGLLAKTQFGRNILEKYPGFCSFGAVGRDGVPEEKAAGTNFELRLVGHGWGEKVTKGAAEKDGDDMFKQEEAPNKEVTVTVKGANIGYGSTSECLVQAALVILQEKDQMPSTGGVYPPGYAFASTSLATRLTAHGVTFTTEVKKGDDAAAESA